MRINIPNQVTIARLFLTLIFFALLSVYSVNDGNTWFVLEWCFWLFLVAALSDMLDGYLARTWKQVTTFGRIIDPVVDKIMVCGAFVFFASPHFLDVAAAPYVNVSGVAPWMVIVLLLREFVVSAIRSHSESHGKDFGATWTGKLKMVLQSATVCVVLGHLVWFDDERYAWIRRLRDACVWATVVVTGLSMFSYARRARAFLLSSTALAGDPGPTDRSDGR